MIIARTLDLRCLSFESFKEGIRTKDYQAIEEVRRGNEGTAHARHKRNKNNRHGRKYTPQRVNVGNRLPGSPLMDMKKDPLGCLTCPQKLKGSFSS